VVASKDEMLSPEKQLENPDIVSSAMEYQKRFSGQVGLWFLEVQSAATKKIISKLEKITLLNVIDVGGGHGQNMEPVLALGHKLTIVGSELSNIKIIQPFIDDKRIDYMESDIFKLPYNNGEFEVVLSYRILAHLQDWEGYIQELTRVSNALVVVDFPSERSVNYFSKSLFGIKNKIEKDTRRYRLYSESDIVNKFSEHGFSPFMKIGQFVLPMALHRLIKVKVLSAFIEGVFKYTGVSHYFASPVIYGFVKKA